MFCFFLDNVGTRAILVAYYDSLSSNTWLLSRFWSVLWGCSTGLMVVAIEESLELSMKMLVACFLCSATIRGCLPKSLTVTRHYSHRHCVYDTAISAT